ncbi:MAG TPA: GNAT family N-acetyltransferase [Anaerolineales bacterium]|jgi:ribosomal-protein-alanine N-acetyltransferase|nr:GNAT family N-acetyltransferase [Anaerolineales bacterium]
MEISPGSPVSIEPATWRDLNALRALEQVCFPQDAWPLLDLIGVLALPNVIRLKAQDDGKMVGFVAADIRRSQGLAWIATIGVLPEFRRRGIGAALLEACEARLNIPRIRLSVRASNSPAIRLYTRLGYHRYGTWPRYYSDGEDALILEKER